MRWGGIFDLDGLKRQLDHLDAQTSAEGFWDDPERAQKTVQERAGIEAVVKKLDGLGNEVKELGELLEMAAMEEDEGMIGDVRRTDPPPRGGRALGPSSTGCSTSPRTAPTRSST